MNKASHARIALAVDKIGAQIEGRRWPDARMLAIPMENEL